MAAALKRNKASTEISPSTYFGAQKKISLGLIFRKTRVLRRQTAAIFCYSAKRHYTSFLKVYTESIQNKQTHPSLKENLLFPKPLPKSPGYLLVYWLCIKIKTSLAAIHFFKLFCKNASWPMEPSNIIYKTGLKIDRVKASYTCHFTMTAIRAAAITSRCLWHHLCIQKFWFSYPNISLLNYT